MTTCLDRFGVYRGPAERRCGPNTGAALTRERLNTETAAKRASGRRVCFFCGAEADGLKRRCRGCGAHGLETVASSGATDTEREC